MTSTVVGGQGVTRVDETGKDSAARVPVGDGGRGIQRETWVFLWQTDKREGWRAPGSTNSSVRSLRSSGASFNTNGSGSSSRNSRATSPSFSYPSLHDPASAPQFEQGQYNNTQPPPPPPSGYVTHYPYPPYQPSSIHTGHRTQDTGHTISEITIRHPHEVQINTQQSLRHTISYFAGIIALHVKPAIFLSTENGKWENIPSSVYTRLASTRSLSPSLSRN